MSKNKAAVIVRWIVVVVMPFLITFATLRLIISWNAPDYPSFEYDRIPPDRYGFSPEERLFYARASLDFLKMSEPADEAIRVLEELRLPGGEGSFYNEREIGHMLDVKKVTDAFQTGLWVAGFIVVGGLIYLLMKKERRPEAAKALIYGGVVTAGVVLIVIVLILVSWNFVFVQFHELLFPPDTWTFSYSDSLIRLFPEQFWFDIGVIWTVSILLVGILAAVSGYFLSRRANRS